MPVIQNPLYHHLATRAFQAENCIIKQDYVLINLSACRDEISDGNTKYTFLNHHLRFSATQDDSNPVLTQWHYTAELVNSITQEMEKIHVYFKQDDSVKEATIGANPAKPLTGFLREQIILHAIRVSTPTLLALRQHVQITYDEIVKEYLTLETNLSTISESHSFTSHEYQTQLRTTMSTLSRLTPLNPYYAKVYNILAGIKPSALPPELETKEEANDKLSPPAESPASIEVIDFAETPKINLELYAKLENIKNIRERILTAKKSKTSPKSRLDDIIEYFNESNEASIILDSKEASLSSDKRHALGFYLADSLREGSSFLSSLLLTAKTANDFEQATRLRNLAPQLPRSIIDYALKKSTNAKLLDFILTHSSLAINTILVDGLSPPMYCYAHHEKKPDLVDCLAVLIKHNASILVDNIQGLPIAHHILAPMSHPLRPALMQNKSKTLENPHFMKSLLNIEKAHMEKLTLENPNHPYRAKLAFAIEERELALIPLSHPLGVTAGMVADAFGPSTAITSQMGSETQQKLQSILEDPDILQLRKTLRIEVDLLIKLLKTKEREAIISRSVRIKEHIEKHLDIDPKAALAPAFKKYAIDILNMYARQISLQRQIIELSHQYDLRTGLFLASSKKHRKELENIAAEMRSVDKNLKIAMSRDFFANYTPESKESKSHDLPQREKNTTLIIDIVNKIKSRELIKSKHLKDRIMTPEREQLDNIMLEEELSIFDDDEISKMLINGGLTMMHEKELERQISALDKVDILNFITQRALTGQVHMLTKINGEKKAIILEPIKKSMRHSNNPLYTASAYANLIIANADYNDDELNAHALIEASPNQIAVSNNRLQWRSKKLIKEFGLGSFVQELEEMHKKADEQYKANRPK